MEPKEGESTPSAEREEAARELVWRANSALAGRLLAIWDEHDPELSEIDNQRHRYARILWAMDDYFHVIGHDKLPEIGTHIRGLGIALDDLIEGITDRLFVTKGSKRDSRRIWGARFQAALGLECLFLSDSDLSRDAAASHATRHHKALVSLLRSPNRSLKGSLLSWYDHYVEGRVPVPALVEEFRTTRDDLKAANLSPAEYRRRAKQAFEQAVKTAIR
jgi:hypothetical protein